MRTLIPLALAGAFIVACGGGAKPSPTPEPTPITDAGSAVAQAVANMSTLSSYHLDITYSPIGSPIVHNVDYANGDYAEHIPAQLAAGTTPADYVFAGDFTYRRDCSADTGVCGAWRREAGRPLIPSLAGTVNSIPETLAPIAAQMATDLTIADATVPKLSGVVDLTAATQENQRRAFAAAGNSPADIEAAIEQLWGGSPDSPGSQPSNIDITLTPDARYIASVVIYIPGQPDDPYFEAAYSAYDAVTVEPPPGFE